jgi:8-hydroxy-5-deazaflavin:NADPH oxidoreductase
LRAELGKGWLEKDGETDNTDVAEKLVVKIGILGSGNIGGTLAVAFAKAGHTVFVSSRHPNNLQKLVAEIDRGAQAGTLEEAAKFGDVIVLAIPWRNKQDLPPADLFSGKVVIDAMNPYSSFGQVMDLKDSTSSEEVAKLMPGARLVKAFNTMGANDLRSGAFKSGTERWTIFVAGDDAKAKGTASRLIEDIGFVPVDTGSLKEGGRNQQPRSPIFSKLLTEEQARAILQLQTAR